ncbi:Voltage gated chloride channel [Chitinophaga eiseniae]|uniref:Voltage gated chloride channel n=1 Tax=Chitinophaga eiseniae TaxID=634771 RepID=A0A1T4R8H3_9BACT|nr:chloride channel protein [Chitinophaga eiseniae]SKA12116.1 Voltage gated chloride channel [Chitinophaga eiseniae]
MKNILTLLYKNGLGINSVLSGDKENFEIVPPEGYLRCIGYLTALGAAAGLLTAGLGMALLWLIRIITNVTFFGKPVADIANPAESEAGIWLLLIPLLGAGVSLLLTRKGIPVWKLPALAVNIGTGAPVGTEGPVMLAAGAFALQAGQKLRISAAEARIMLVAGAASGVAWYFGAPVSALLLALELWLGSWSLLTVLPVLAGILAGALARYGMYSIEPFFTMGPGPELNIKAFLVYLVLGLIIGLMAAGIIRASRGLARLAERLRQRHPWWLVLFAVPVGVLGYLAPESLGNGEVYGSYLLQAHVTLQLLFVAGVVKLIAWLFFMSGNNTGTTITPLLIMGGAIGLLLAVAAQFMCPGVVINPVMASLIGMGALFAGVTRAWLSAIVLMLELTHCLPAAAPVAGAAIIAFAVSWPLIKTRRTA